MSSKSSSFFSGLAAIIVFAALAKFAWVGTQKFILPLFEKAGDAVTKTVSPATHDLIERERASGYAPSAIAQPTAAERALIQKLQEPDSAKTSADGYQLPSR